MTQKTFIFVLLALVIAGGIYFFSQNRADKSETSEGMHADTDSIPAQTQPSIEERKDSTKMSRDTINKKNNGKKIVPPPPPVDNFAPGTAMIRATILSVEYEDDLPGRILVRVDEVMGYGSSTPPIATKTELSLNIFDYLKSHPNYKNMIQEEAEVKMVIASQQEMQIGESEKKQNWQLVEFKQ